MKNKESMQELLSVLYFSEGLEDLPHLWNLKPKYLKNWCETKGKKLKDIMFALVMKTDPEFILEKLSEEKPIKK